MSGKQKVLLIAVAAALIVVFIVAVAGRRPGDGDPAGHSAFVDWLGKLGGKQGAIPASLVTADCPRTNDTVTVTGTCTLHVADPKSLKLLDLTSSARFQVTAPAPGKADYTATDTVKPDEHGVAHTRVAVDKPSDVTVACPGQCAVTVGRG